MRGVIRTKSRSSSRNLDESCVFQLSLADSEDGESEIRPALLVEGLAHGAIKPRRPTTGLVRGHSQPALAPSFPTLTTTRFPPCMSGYLTSSALSPAHYAFVQRVENAVSSSELEHVCQAEIDRLRAKLGKGGTSDVRPHLGCLPLSRMLYLLSFSGSGLRERGSCESDARRDSPRIGWTGRDRWDGLCCRARSQSSRGRQEASVSGSG